MPARRAANACLALLLLPLAAATHVLEADDQPLLQRVKLSPQAAAADGSPEKPYQVAYSVYEPFVNRVRAWRSSAVRLSTCAR